MCQEFMIRGHLFRYKDCEQTAIPVGGIPCFSEANSAWSGPPQALLHLLNDPILSRLDVDGQCIAFNTVVFSYVDRVSRCLAEFDILEAEFRKRGVEIWCLSEGIGSITHREQFRGLVKRAEEYSNQQSGKIKHAYKVKGLPNCSPHEPRAIGDGWGPKEDARLIQFIRPLVNIPPKYFTAAKGRSKCKIKWSYLASQEFKFRTGAQLEIRVTSLALHGLRVG
jgi:hypothetical protein